MHPQNGLKVSPQHH